MVCWVVQLHCVDVSDSGHANSVKLYRLHCQSARWRMGNSLSGAGCHQKLSVYQMANYTLKNLTLLVMSCSSYNFSEYSMYQEYSFPVPEDGMNAVGVPGAAGNAVTVCRLFLVGRSHNSHRNELCHILKIIPSYHATVLAWQ